MKRCTGSGYARFSGAKWSKISSFLCQARQNIEDFAATFCGKISRRPEQNLSAGVGNDHSRSRTPSMLLCCLSYKSGSSTIPYCTTVHPSSLAQMVHVPSQYCTAYRYVPLSLERLLQYYCVYMKRFNPG